VGEWDGLCEGWLIGVRDRGGCRKGERLLIDWWLRKRERGRRGRRRRRRKVYSKLAQCWEVDSEREEREEEEEVGLFRANAVNEANKQTCLFRERLAHRLIWQHR